MRFSWVKNELAAHPCQWNSQLFRDNHQASDMRGQLLPRFAVLLPVCGCQGPPTPEKRDGESVTDAPIKNFAIPNWQSAFWALSFVQNNPYMAAFAHRWGIKMDSIRKDLKNFCMATQFYSSLRKKKADNGMWAMKYEIHPGNKHNQSVKLAIAFRKHHNCDKNVTHLMWVLYNIPQPYSTGFS